MVELQMGYFWEGIPAPLLRWAVETLGPNGVAVESGTYKGDSTALLAENFCAVVTIERSHEFARAAQGRFHGQSNVTVLYGSSADLLQDALPNRDIAALFWLDAHYSGGKTAGADYVCPALEELAIISAARSPDNTVVLVDDARSFLPSEGWPSIGDLCRLLERSGLDAVLVDDVLVGARRETLRGLHEHLEQTRTTQVPSLFPVYGLTHMAARTRNASHRVATRVRNKAMAMRSRRP